MSDRIMNSRKMRRRLAPGEKYEMFVSGAHRAGHPARGCREVGRGPLHHGARVPDREAGGAGRAQITRSSAAQTN